MPELQSSDPKEEIERICGSPAFLRSPKQTQLLRYLAGEAIAGRGRELNQYLIATDGMGLSEKFDPTRNSCVRVSGIRLRRMLEEYYRDDQNCNLLRVRLPERSFCPVFEVRGEPLPEPSPEEMFPRLAVIEFRAAGLGGVWRHFPIFLAEKMVACLAAMPGVSVLGPIERGKAPGLRAGSREAVCPHPVDFTLDGSLHVVGNSCLAQARLLRTDSGIVCRTESFHFKARGKKIVMGDLAVFRKLTRFVGDGVGAGWREADRASLRGPGGQLSAKEAMMHVWHAYSTMDPRDISAAQKAIKTARAVRGNGGGAR